MNELPDVYDANEKSTMNGLYHDKGWRWREGVVKYLGESEKLENGEEKVRKRLTATSWVGEPWKTVALNWSAPFLDAYCAPPRATWGGWKDPRS